MVFFQIKNSFNRLDFESINDVQILGQSYSVTSEQLTEGI